MSATTTIGDFFDRELIKENFGASRSFLDLEEELKDTREADELKAGVSDDSKPFGYAFELDGTLDVNMITQFHSMEDEIAGHSYDPEAQIWTSSHDSTQIRSALTFCFRGTCGYFWGFDNNVDDGWQ
ncbi:hypothetical protein ABGB14_39300 [Nonomuraea sp. B10E15]|uniref:hypothetical protein n=1 Tax=unclassified Nonomuraea TaxID=2593643 RepID=UPI00325E62D9